MTSRDKARALLAEPAALARALGYKDMRDDLHGLWMKRMLTAAGDMTLQAHRGSFKTTCLCLVIALLMIKERDRNIIFLRKTDNDVAEVVQTVQRILTSDVFCQIYTALTGSELALPRATNTELSCSAYSAPRGAPQLLGVGIGGSLTGKHADIVITDDIVNLKDRVSRAEREHTKQIYMELRNVLNPGGRFINTGTPWHVEDAFTLMPKPEKYDCYTTGMLTSERLDALRQSMTPSLFAANYELKHIASEKALFTGAPTFTDDAALLRDGVAHVDAAYGGEDGTAFTCAKKRGDTIYLYGRLFPGHVDTVLERILQDARSLKCAPVHCEDNGDKGFLAKEITRRGYRAKTYHENENKFLKISGYLRKWWPHIVFLRGTDAAYLNQIFDYSEDAQHDDAPDSAASAIRILDNPRRAIARSDIYV